MGAMTHTPVERLRRSGPFLTGIVRVRGVCPTLCDSTSLHAGLPINLAEMNGPRAGAVIGALVLEGLTRQDADEAVRSGEVTLRTCHDAGSSDW